VRIIAECLPDVPDGDFEQHGVAHEDAGPNALE
jgi:hypothetical protein